VYVRKTDDAPAVRLGEGHALASRRTESGRLDAAKRSRRSWCCYTGPGEPRRLPTGSFANVLRAAWLPGATVLANESGQAARLTSTAGVGGAPRAFTPEGVGPTGRLPDGAGVAATGPGPAAVSCMASAPMRRA
jgi:hypothetical protein